MCIGADVEMGKSNQRYVAKSEKNLGWRVWDRKMECWWGEWRKNYPEVLLTELNGLKRTEVLTKLCRKK